MPPAANKLRVVALALSVAIGLLTLSGCAGLMRGYVSSPTAEGGIEKSETELCVTLQTLDLCAKSATVLDQFHLFFLGLYAGVPLPLIPVPSGIYAYFFPPATKPAAEEITIRLFDNEQTFTFDPTKVVLEKSDRSTWNPTQFECAVDELGYQRKFTSVVLIPPTKGIYCHLTFESHEWDFDLRVNGIEIKDRPVEAPLIRFRRGVERSWKLKA
jgi:hypothetical protein